jgi:hypothetical protein
MADNLIYDPLLNPVKFYDLDLVNDPAFYTKHFDDYPFEERLLPWQDAVTFKQIWQTTDIIYLQFESEFDPIIIELENTFGETVITLPAIVGLPNQYYPNTRSYEVAMSLADLPSGCYRVKRTRGSGDEEKIDYTKWMYISDTPFDFPTMLVQYWHSRFKDGVMFETGIRFQVRIPGHIGRLKPGRVMESYKDQRYNPSVLSSRAYRGFPAVFGDEFGLPDDMIDLINRIWGCNNVMLDNKSFAAIGTEMEQITVGTNEDHPKSGLIVEVEEGVNRDSKIFTQTLDVNKKLVYGIMVSNKVWGDTSNQGSSNTVPVINIE